MVRERILKMVDEKIEHYKGGKLIDSNFTVEDRATAMVVLENLKDKLNEVKDDK